MCNVQFFYCFETEKKDTRWNEQSVRCFLCLYFFVYVCEENRNRSIYFCFFIFYFILCCSISFPLSLFIYILVSKFSHLLSFFFSIRYAIFLHTQIYSRKYDWFSYVWGCWGRDCSQASFKLIKCHHSLLLISSLLFSVSLCLIYCSFHLFHLFTFHFLCKFIFSIALSFRADKLPGKLLLDEAQNVNE